MKLKSFGCSFIFGTDLPDDGHGGAYATASQLTWPALVAKHHGLEYQCLAKGGAGNLLILSRLLAHAANDSDSIFVVGWTWIDRFDYADDFEKTSNDWKTLCPITTGPVADTYYRHLHSERRDLLTSLSYIHTAIATLESRNIPYIMTYMDELLIDRSKNQFPSITCLQDYVTPRLQNFEGKTFLDWSRQKGFSISDTWHPLVDAHAAAAELMIPVSDAILHRV